MEVSCPRICCKFLIQFAKLPLIPYFPGPTPQNLPPQDRHSRSSHHRHPYPRSCGWTLTGQLCIAASKARGVRVGLEGQREVVQNTLEAPSAWKEILPWYLLKIWVSLQMAPESPIRTPSPKKCT